MPSPKLPRRPTVPPPSESDVYLAIRRPETINPETARRFGSDYIGRDYLRLTPYDQMFLRKFGIRVP